MYVPALLVYLVTLAGINICNRDVKCTEVCSPVCYLAFFQEVKFGCGVVDKGKATGLVSFSFIIIKATYQQIQFFLRNNICKEAVFHQKTYPEQYVRNT